MSAYELHIGVKDYCFGRDDRLIGVSVMQLKDIMDQVPCNHLLCNAKANIHEMFLDKIFAGLIFRDGIAYWHGA
jgi:hypothetical protein